VPLPLRNFRDFPANSPGKCGIKRFGRETSELATALAVVREHHDADPLVSENHLAAIWNVFYAK
jgi:hypothetical protein